MCTSMARDVHWPHTTTLISPLNALDALRRDTQLPSAKRNTLPAQSVPSDTQLPNTHARSPVAKAGGAALMLPSCARSVDQATGLGSHETAPTNPHHLKSMSRINLIGMTAILFFTTKISPPPLKVMRKWTLGSRREKRHFLIPFVYLWFLFVVLGIRVRPSA